VLVGAIIFKVLIVGVALSLDVFAVSVGIGVRNLSRSKKIHIGIAFACAEVVMIVIGAGLGVLAGRVVGDYAGYIGFAALFGLGIVMMRESRSGLENVSRLDLASGAGLALASLAVSLDSLGVGFSVLYIGVPLPISLIIIGAVSIASTSLGLVIGRWLGRAAERNAALVGGMLLALSGVLFAALKALRVG
jgi:manganese efflux pump family protein